MTRRSTPQRRTTDGNSQPEHLDSVPVANHAERERLWDTYDRLPEGYKLRAEENLKVLTAYYELMDRSPDPKEAEIIRDLKEQFDVQTSGSKLRGLRRRVSGHDRGDWLPLLSPHWKVGEAHAEFSESAWRWLKREWGILSQPAVAPLYRRLQKLAADHGWPVPSLSTARRRLNALPETEKILLRKGKKALDELFPSLERDYRSIELHEIWCTDGRKADVSVRWPDGSIGRPIVVGFIDERSRVLFGFAIGKTENADLVRRAMKCAVDHAGGVVPQEIQADNGRAFASKQISGGAPTRFRFKPKEDEPLGIWPALGIKIGWAKPYCGRSKPIESMWRVFAQADKRREFEGAYHGRAPHLKPENFDEKNAVPLELFAQVYREEAESYNARQHRGHAMEEKSPRQIYEELLPSVTPRLLTAAQLRLCMLAVVKVKPAKRDHCIRVLGNRYWTQGLARLDPRKGFDARYDPVDLSQPISLYDGRKYLFDVPLIERTGFKDHDSMKKHRRARAEFNRSVKEAAESSAQMASSEEWASDSNSGPDDHAAALPLPSPKVIKLHRAKVETPRVKPDSEKADDHSEELTDDKVAALLAKDRMQRAGGK